MFWTQKQITSPQIEAMLNRADCTIYDLMNDEDILQECKSLNKKLIDFLAQPNVMDQLITIMIHNPIMEVAECFRYRYPHIACEILSCDIPLLNEKLAGLRTNVAKRNIKQLSFWMRVWKIYGLKMWCKQGDYGLLQKLYSFIETEEPLNPLLASFFSRAMGILVVRSKDQNWYSYQFTCLQVITFLKGREKCIDLFLHHLETSAIMNLVLKFVIEIEGPDTRQNILDWLNSQNLVQRLVQLLSPLCKPSRHSNASELLCDMINGIRDSRKNSTERSVESDPIFCTLESEETTVLLLNTILVNPKLESSIVGGIQVLLTLLKSNNNSNSNDQNRSSNSEDAAENAIELNISNAIIPYLERFHDLLLNPPYMPPVKTTVGILEVPVGNTRLFVLKLFVALLSVENPNIRAKLVELDVFQTFLDLFFEYPWNNFLHTQVQYALKETLNSVFPESDYEFYEYIFVKCRLLNKILDAYATNGALKSGRVGYMGHLIEMTKDIVEQCEKNNVLNTFLTTNLPQEIVDQWQNLVSVDLVYIKSMQQTLSAQQYMDDADSNNTEYLYSQESYEQQVPQPDSNYIEVYECRNKMFNEGEKPLLFPNDIEHSDSVIHNAEDQDKNEDMFNRLCDCRDKGNFDDDKSADDPSPWSYSDDKVLTDKIWWEGQTAKLERSSSSEEEDEVEKDDEDVELWKTFSNVMKPVNPWDINAPAQSESENWAHFATSWPGESEATTHTDSVSEKVDDTEWACFANFDSALTFTIQEDEPDLDIVGAAMASHAVEFEREQQQKNLNEDTAEEEQATKQNLDVVEASDDDNANPIVMIENRNLEGTKDMSCDENVQNIVETVNSSDSSPLVNVIENSDEAVNQ